MADRSRLVISILVGIVLLMGLFMLYLFVLQPAMQGYVIEKQTEGVQIAVGTILTQIQQYGFVQIPIGENQVLTLVPAQAPQQVQPQA